MSLSDSHHFRKLVAGVCMVLAPLFLIVSVILHPEAGTSAASQAAAITGDPDAWYAAHALALAAIVLTVPAVLGLMHMLREKQAVAGHVGGALALVGLLAFVGLVAMEMTFWQAGGEAETAAMIDRVSDTLGLVIPFYAMTFGFVAGLVVLAYGLFAARAVSPLMAACLGGSAVLIAVASVTATMWVAVAAAVMLAIGFGMTGFMVLAETDGEWEHTPEYHGIRHVAGAA